MAVLGSFFNPPSSWGSHAYCFVSNLLIVCLTPHCGYKEVVSWKGFCWGSSKPGIILGYSLKKNILSFAPLTLFYYSYLMNCFVYIYLFSWMWAPWEQRCFLFSTCHVPSAWPLVRAQYIFVKSIFEWMWWSSHYLLESGLQRVIVRKELNWEPRNWGSPSSLSSASMCLTPTTCKVS